MNNTSGCGPARPAYYNGDELLSRHINLNFVCGDRFGGKSTWAQRYVLNKAIRSIQYNIKHNPEIPLKEQSCTSQFSILSRYDKDINTLCQTYFDNTMSMFYGSWVLTYTSKRYYLWNREWDNSDLSSKQPGILVGYGMALNNATKMKSTSYPYIDTLILEEFMNLEGKYIHSAAQPDLEVELLISLYSTIARGNGHQVRNNVKVLAISNNFYLNNPYFRYFNLIDRIMSNPFQRFYVNRVDPQCCIEMTHNDVKIRMGRDDVNKGNKFIDMQHQLRLVKNPIVNNVLFGLSFDNKRFLYCGNYNDSYVVFASDKIRPNTVIYSCSQIKRIGIYDIASFKSSAPDTYKPFKQLFEMNQLYYDSLSTYILLYNIMNFSPNA